MRMGIMKEKRKTSLKTEDEDNLQGNGCDQSRIDATQGTRGSHYWTHSNPHQPMVFLAKQKKLPVEPDGSEAADVLFLVNNGLIDYGHLNLSL